MRISAPASTSRMIGIGGEAGCTAEVETGMAGSTLRRPPGFRRAGTLGCGHRKGTERATHGAGLRSGPQDCSDVASVAWRNAIWSSAGAIRVERAHDIAVGGGFVELPQKAQFDQWLRIEIDPQVDERETLAVHDEERRRLQ